MHELELFRGFRSDVAAPSVAAQRRASARLADAVDATTPAMGLLRFITQRPRYSALALAALAGATAAALFVSTPWNSSPGFLARAQAALAEDQGTILHAKWEETWTSSDPACTVVRGPNEIWVDQAPPHRLRAVMEKPTSGDGPPAARTIVCAPGTRVELHGSAPSGYKFSAAFPGDPVQALREAISTGRAHDEGEMQLDGRTVRRIRVELRLVTVISACPTGAPLHVRRPRVVLSGAETRPMRHTNLAFRQPPVEARFTSSAAI